MHEETHAVTRIGWLRAAILGANDGGSGVGILLEIARRLKEEAPALGKPVLVMRTNTERPEAVAAGAAKLVGVSQETIVAGARELLSSSDLYAKMSQAVNPFGDGHAAERIVESIERYFAS